ncbi:MAG TPA: sensor domain-containing diguanylate cyclase [Planktothrix sp.]
MDDAVNDKLKLLSSIDLDEVAQAVADIVGRSLKSQIQAVLMWDPDLESFGEKYLFGARKKDLVKFIDEFAESAEPPGAALAQLDLDDYKTKVPDDLQPIYCCRLEKDVQAVSYLLIAGCEDEDEKEISQLLSEYPFVAALDHAWQFRELERENARLRSQYEAMEDRTTSLEDQTRKLINDVTMKDAFRTKRVEQDRLVYLISNAVRSSVNIQKVLETSVEQIGSTFGASRCIMLRSLDTPDQLSVYEFNRPGFEPVKDKFLTEPGLRFAQTAFSRQTNSILDRVDGNRCGFEPEFLHSMQVVSGLVVPLVMRDRVIGVMFLQSCDNEGLTIEDTNILQSLADNLSVAIENADLHAERERQAVTDGLTGVANRRCFNESFARELESARRYDHSLSLVMIDLDFLKKINDTFGHAVGDEAIKAIGKMLKQRSRSVDIPARYGGEEFCVLLPKTDVDEAEQLAERLRRFIAELEIEGPGQITASIGVGSYPLHADELDDLFARVDEALYVAKQSGRNRVCVAVRAKVQAPTPPAAELNGNGATEQEIPGTGADTESSPAIT